MAICPFYFSAIPQPMRQLWHDWDYHTRRPTAFLMGKMGQKWQPILYFSATAVKTRNEELWMQITMHAAAASPFSKSPAARQTHPSTLMMAGWWAVRCGAVRCGAVRCGEWWDVAVTCGVAVRMGGREGGSF